MGLTSYYLRFIPNFTKWAGPLHALIVPASFKQKICKGRMKKSDLPKFQWTSACQEGFDQLKKALTEAPILAYPDYSKPFHFGNRCLVKRPRCRVVSEGRQ